MPQMNPFVAHCKSVATDIPIRVCVGCWMFRVSYRICAGGKNGITKVMAASARKKPANTAAADMLNECKRFLSLLL